jgi:hypothetical protein
VFVMRRLRLLVLAVLALSALAAVLASSTSAFLLENLPEKARTVTGESVGGATVLETVGGNAITCEKATAEGTEETSKPPLGLMHFTFIGCKTVKPLPGLACTGEGDTSGRILVLITWHLWFDKNPTGELKTGFVFLGISVLFNCGNGLVLVHVLGSLVCLHLNPTVKGKTHELHCIQTKGVQEHHHWWDQNGVEGTAKLETSINGGAFEESGQLGLGTYTTVEETVADQ